MTKTVDLLRRERIRSAGLRRTVKQLQGKLGALTMRALDNESCFLKASGERDQLKRDNVELRRLLNAAIDTLMREIGDRQLELIAGGISAELQEIGAEREQTVTSEKAGADPT